MKGEDCISVVEHLVSMCDVLGSIPGTDREVRKSQRRENVKASASSAVSPSRRLDIDSAHP